MGDFLEILHDFPFKLEETDIITSKTTISRAFLQKGTTNEMGCEIILNHTISGKIGYKNYGKNK
jgi:hypothetical protein